MQKEVHSADSTIAGGEAVDEHSVVAAAVPDSAFATILLAKQTGKEAVIAATGPVDSDSGPKDAEGKAAVAAAVVVVAAAASEAAIAPIHSDLHLNFPKMLGGWQ